MSLGINYHFTLKDLGYSNCSLHALLPRHRWYLYKEGFSTNLVSEAIARAQIGEGDIVLDPFNGSGTTTLTAATLGIDAIGIEVNPFTSFLANTKLHNASVKKITKIGNQLVIMMTEGSWSNLIGFSTFSKRNNLEKWLFNVEVLRSFEAGWQGVSSIKDRSIRDLLQLSLISAAMKNCNAKRDGKCLRYYNNWQSMDHSTISFVGSFNNILSTIIEDIQNSIVSSNPKIIQGDCRNVLTSLPENAYKLCVTSPPYLNTFDYTDIYRPELFLGKFVQNNKELYELRMKTVRSHIQTSWALPKKTDFGLLYSQAMAHVINNRDSLMSPRIPTMIQAYFEDMFNILSLLFQKAAPRAQVWFVVSNSAYANYEIPVDLILGEIGTKAGWYLKEIGVLRHIRKRKTKKSPDISELRESVIIFSNSK